MNLTLKIEKQEMNDLNNNNALRDYFDFCIAQVGNNVAESGNVAYLGNWPEMLKVNFYMWNKKLQIM